MKKIKNFYIIYMKDKEQDIINQIIKYEKLIQAKINVEKNTQILEQIISTIPIEKMFEIDEYIIKNQLLK